MASIVITRFDKTILHNTFFKKTFTEGTLVGKRVPLMSLSSQTNPCVNKTSCTTYGYFLFSTLWPNHWIGVKEASVHCGTFEVACKLLSTHFMSPRMYIYIRIHFHSLLLKLTNKEVVLKIQEKRERVIRNT